MRKANVPRKGSVRLFVGKVVRDVGEEGALRFELLNQFQGVLHVGVRGMRAVAQGVEEENIESAKLRFRVVWNFAEIREVGCRAKAISDDGLAAVKDFDRLEAGSEQFHRTVEFFQMNFGQGRVIGIAVEDILEYTFDLLRGRCPSVKRDGTLLMPKAQRPKIVEPKNVVSVRVRVEDSVHASDA